MDNLIINRHPFFLDEAVEFQSAEFLPDECLGEYVIRHGIVLPAGYLSVYINGRKDPKWPYYDPKPNDVILISASAHGGGARKVGRIVGLVAVAAAGVATAGLVAPLVGGGIFGSLAGGLAAGVVMTGGSLLVNSLLPAPKPQAPAVEDKKESPTYGINGGNNRANQYGPMALVFGRHRMVPYLGANPYSTFEGNDNYFWQIFHFGLQPDLKVDNIRIGENPIENYQGVELERSEADGKIYSIAGNVDMQPGFGITVAEGLIQRRSPPDTVQISIDISALVFQIDPESAKPVDNFTQAQIWYRKVGTTDWIPFGEGRDGGGPGNYNIRLNIPDKYVYFRATADVERGQYDLLFKKGALYDQKEAFASNDTKIALLRFIQEDRADYTGQLRYGLKIRASDQLNGVVNQLSCIASASCFVWNGDSWEYRETSNPAWWLLWFARGKRDESGNLIYGEGLDDDQIDIEAIKRWARFCDDKNLTFDYILDRKARVSEVLAMIARAGRATTSRSIGKRTVVWDADDKPAQYTITPANVVAGSFQVDYINDDVVDEIIVNFVNRDLDYKQDTVRQRVPETDITDNPITLDLEGVVTAEQAGREANLIAASQFFHTRQYSWEMDVEGAVIRKGEVVLCPFDLASYEHSGRLLHAEGTSITLDAAITGSNIWLVIRDPYNHSIATKITANKQDVIDIGDWPAQDVNDLDSDFFAPDAETAQDYIWYASPTDLKGRTLLIKSVEPQGQGHVKFTAIDYDSRYYASENDLYTHVPRRLAVVKDKIYSLTATEGRLDDGSSVVRFAWDTAFQMSETYVTLTINDAYLESFNTTRRLVEVPANIGDKVGINVSLKNGDYKTLSYVVQGSNQPMPDITNLGASTDLVNKIHVSWIMPINNPDIARTEIWASRQNDRSTATKLTDVAYPENNYNHLVDGLGQVYYYWVRPVGKHGKIGAWYPDTTEGVRGQTTADAQKIINTIGEEAFASAVGKELTGPIADIEKNEAAIQALKDRVEADNNKLRAEAREEAQKAIQKAQDVLNDAKNELAKEIDANKDEINASINQTLTTAKQYADQAVNQRASDLSAKITENQAEISGLQKTISDTKESVASDISSLESRVNGKYPGAKIWNPTEKFPEGAIVIHNGHYYQSDRGSTGVRPDKPDSVVWQDLGAIGDNPSTAINDALRQAQSYTDQSIASNNASLQASIDGVSNAVNQSASAAQAYTDKAVADATSSLQSKINGTNADITALRQSIADGDAALAKALQSLESRADNQSTAINDVLRQANAYTDKAISTSTDAINAQLGDNKASINRVNNAISDLRQSVASDISSLESRVSANKNNDIAALRDEINEVKATADKATTEAATQAQSLYDDAKSRIDSLSKTVADNKDAAASAQQDLQSAIYRTAGRLQQAEANVQQAQQTAVDARGATATLKQQIETKVNDIDGRVAINAGSINWINDRVSNSYTIRVEQDENGQKYAAGMGIGVDNDKGKTQSYVLFQANTFAIKDPSGGVQYPLVIRDGRVMINDALINKATIADLTVGTIRDASGIIDTRQLADGAVSKQQQQEYGVSITLDELRATYPIDPSFPTDGVRKKVATIDVTRDKAFLFKVLVSKPPVNYDPISGRNIDVTYRFEATDANDNRIFDFPVGVLDAYIPRTNKINIYVITNGWGDMTVQLIAVQLVK